MKRRFFLAVTAIWLGLGSNQARAVEGIYLGAQVGHVSLTGNTGAAFSNALGFGVDLSFEASHLFNVTTRFQYSTHSGSGGLDLYHPSLSVDFFLARYAEFLVTLGGGPGFYFFNTAAGNESNFGLNVGLEGDVILNESVRVGLGWRYHGVLGGTVGDNFFTIMMRIGFQFELDG